jgi:hypothetical protein
MWGIGLGVQGIVLGVCSPPKQALGVGTEGWGEGG